MFALYVFQSSVTRVYYLVRAFNDRPAWRNLAFFLKRDLSEVISSNEFSIIGVATPRAELTIEIKGVVVYVDI